MSTTTKPNNEEYINKLYDTALSAGKGQLEQDYSNAIADLDAQKKANRQTTDANLTRTAVEAQKAQKNFAQVQQSQGLTSGSMAQARLAQDNQLQADLTTLRTAQQTADDGIESQRALLARQYAAAITQAQAENDLARAEALYAEAQRQEQQLLSRQEQAAQLMATAGDYSLYGQLLGLTPEQIAKLGATYTRGSSGGAAAPTGGAATDTPFIQALKNAGGGAVAGVAKDLITQQAQVPQWPSGISEETVETATGAVSPSAWSRTKNNLQQLILSGDQAGVMRYMEQIADSLSQTQFAELEAMLRSAGYL